MYGLAKKYAPVSHTAEPIVSFELVTPDMAARWLEHNAVNRKLRENTVSRYTERMIEGRWRAKCSMLILDPDSVILDGQHRLSAIVRSGCSVWFVVVRNMPRETMDVVDDHQIRNLGDTLHIEGHPNANWLAATARIIVGFMRSERPGPVVFQAKLDRVQAREFLAEHADVVTSMEVTEPMRRAHLLKPALASALHYLFWHSPAGSRADADAFFDKLITGHNLQTTDAIYQLRSRLERERGAKKELKTPELAALVIKAWNRRTMPTTSLRWRNNGEKPEPFPIIL